MTLAILLLAGSEWKCLWMAALWTQVECPFCGHIQLCLFFPLGVYYFFASWCVFNFFYFSSEVCSRRPQTTAERKGRLSQLLTLIACCVISLSPLPNGAYVDLRGREGLWRLKGRKWRSPWKSDLALCSGWREQKWSWRNSCSLITVLAYLVHQFLSLQWHHLKWVFSEEIRVMVDRIQQSSIWYRCVAGSLATEVAEHRAWPIRVSGLAATCFHSAPMGLLSLGLPGGLLILPDGLFRVSENWPFLEPNPSGWLDTWSRWLEMEREWCFLANLAGEGTALKGKVSL